MWYKGQKKSVCINFILTKYFKINYVVHTFPSQLMLWVWASQRSFGCQACFQLFCCYGRKKLLIFFHQEQSISPSQGPHPFFFCCPFSITKEPSEILVIGSDYWVTLYLVIITFLSKATSHLTTWSSNSILNSHTFLQPMVSLLPCQSWVLCIFF